MFCKNSSHLIAIENTKIKRGDQKTFYLIALEMIKFVGSSQNYRPQAKKAAIAACQSRFDSGSHLSRNLFFLF